MPAVFYIIGNPSGFPMMKKCSAVDATGAQIREARYIGMALVLFAKFFCKLTDKMYTAVLADNT